MKIITQLLTLLALTFIFFLPNSTLADEEAAVLTPNEHWKSHAVNISVVTRTMLDENKLFDSELHYLVLAAEMCINRDNFEQSLDYYLKAAQMSKQKAIAERATQLAVHMQNIGGALIASKLWADTAPESIEAQQTISSLLFQTGAQEAAYFYLTKLLLINSEDIEKAFSKISEQFTSNAVRSQFLQMLKRLANEYNGNPIAHLAVAHVAAQVEDFEMASFAIKQALLKSPKLQKAVILQAEIYQLQKKEKLAVEYLAKYINKNPNAHDIRLLLAEIYLEQEELNKAKKQLIKLLDHEKLGNAASIYLGQIYLHQDNYSEAENAFKMVLNDAKLQNTARFLIANLHVKRNDTENAISWYKQVYDGEFHVQSQMQAAQMLAENDFHDDAIDTLHRTNITSKEELKQVYLTEAKIWYMAGKYKVAYESLNKALEQLPNDIDILYSRALLCEKMNQWEQLEADLKLILKLEPNHASALNALGYALVQNTNRYDEARKYINKAMEIAPNDPSVIDSLGWLYYHEGNYQKAIALLNKALSLSNDSDIAAHLAEVLLKNGDVREAKKVLKNALKNAPDHPEINSLLKQLDGV